MEVVDPATVKVTLKQPDGNLIYNLAWGDAVIVAPESADGNKTNPIGTGPFGFKRPGRGRQHHARRKNHAYWGTPVKLDTARPSSSSPTPTAAFAALQAGDVDTFPNFPAPETVAQFQNDPRFRVVIGSTEGEAILTMNNAKPPLDNIKVREAIAHAIDRQAIIDGAMFGYGTPIGTFFAAGQPDYVDLTAQSNFDPEKSKALLAEGAAVTDLDAVAEAAAGRGLCPPRRRDHRQPAGGRRHQDRDHQPRMGASGWARCSPTRTTTSPSSRHTEPNDIGIFAPRRLLLQLQVGRLQQDHRRSRRDHRTRPSAPELTKAAAKKLADNYVVGLPVRARQGRGRERQAQGHVGERTHPGHRPHRRLLGAVILERRC